MNKIKVCECVSRLQSGGVEAVILNYISHFKNLENFELHILTQDINDDKCIKQFQDAGFIIHIVTHKRKSVLKNTKEVYKIFKEEKFDIVHSHMTLTNFHVLFLAKLCGVKCRISHSHNVFFENGIKDKITWPFIKWLNCVTATNLMACGELAGRFLFGDKNVDNGNVTILYNAIDLNKYKYNENVRNNIRKELGIENKFVVGHIGRFLEQKNHTYIIDIFNEITKINKNAVLLLIGVGELFDEIKKKVNDLGLEDKVIFLGSKQDAYSYYSAMDVFIFPSLYEGLSVVLIEAQTNGLSCIASDTITKETEVSNKISYLSIKDDPKVWAEKVINTNRFEETIYNDAYNEYDITKAASKLENIYLKG